MNQGYIGPRHNGFGYVTQEQILAHRRHKLKLKKFYEAGVKIIADRGSQFRK